MLNYESYKPKKRKVRIEKKYRPRPPKGSREHKSGYYVFRIDDEGEEHFLARFDNPSLARSHIENIYLPKAKEGSMFAVRRMPDDMLVTKVMRFEGHAITTTPLGGLGRLP